MTRSPWREVPFVRRRASGEGVEIGATGTCVVELRGQSHGGIIGRNPVITCDGVEATLHLEPLVSGQHQNYFRASTSLRDIERARMIR